MDRNLGLVLAIMTERTKLNKKIEALTAPVKEFQDQVQAFYEKLSSGGVSSENLKEESRGLQGALKDTLKLITGKELKQMLKMKERLEAQQLQAADRIKGLDDETKANLMAVLQGQSLPGAGAGGAAASSKPGAGEASIDVMKRWLRSQKIPRLSYNAGATTKAGAHQFREFMELYGFHPKAITDVFSANVDAQADGFARFPRDFSELLRRAQTILDYDTQRFAYEQRAQKVPGVAPPEPPMPGIKEEVREEKKEEKEEAKAAPAPAPAAKEEVKTPAVPAAKIKAPGAAKPKKKPHEIAQAVKEQLDKEKAKKPAPLPEEKTPRIPLTEAPPEVPVAKADDLVISTAQRTARQITRLGRVRKMAQLFPISEPLEEDDFQQAEEMGMLAPEDEDVYMIPSGRLERFDEEKDYDPAQTGVEMYHGEREEDAMRGGEDDEDGGSWGWRNELRSREKQDTLNSLLSKMEQFGTLWRNAPDEGARALIQTQLDKLQAEYDRLEEKQKLENEKKLPEGWADDK